MLHLFIEIWAIVALAFVLGAGPFGYWLWAKRAVVATKTPPKREANPPVLGPAVGTSVQPEAIVLQDQQSSSKAQQAPPEAPPEAPPVLAPNTPSVAVVPNTQIAALEHFEPMAQPTLSWPSFLTQPQGTPDDLTRLPGITPALQEQLYRLGVFHYAQIASWSPQQVSQVDAQLGSFRGVIARERWQAHAERLCTQRQHWSA